MSVGAWINCAVIRTCSPTRSTEPSTTASTFNSRAISGSGFLTPLYCMIDVRDLTCSAPIFPRSAISASVIPSAKYSCSGSPDRFSSGSTASDTIRPGLAPPSSCSRHRPIFSPTTTSAPTTSPIAIAHRHRVRTGAAGLAAVAVAGKVSVSFISIAASPMSRSRRRGSFSKQRRSRTRMFIGVVCGSISQSGSRSMMRASISVAVSLSNGG
ncbi:hypothetical protein ES703_114557 [subsurface metagenome]